ncbi:MAG: carboxypeptidase regulatory-like domain-containing protein, partial [Pyrinomonadaceae bacterium]|nr:carboxypeptidase regulatory-like domain-containing protein [Pyrinomonadaceae bacterium]
MSKSNLHRLICALLLLAFGLVCGAGSSALAQSAATGGQIVGTVTDQQGAAVPNASVTVSNAATGLTQTLTTNDEGGFRAVSLAPGDYTVEVTASGFGKSTQTGYKVEVGSSLDANITLGVE